MVDRPTAPPMILWWQDRCWRGIEAMAAANPDAVHNGGDPTLASSYSCQNTVQIANPFTVGKASPTRD